MVRLQTVLICFKGSFGKRFIRFITEKPSKLCHEVEDPGTSAYVPTCTAVVFVEPIFGVVSKQAPIVFATRKGYTLSKLELNIALNIFVTCLVCFHLFEINHHFLVI